MYFRLESDENAVMKASMTSLAAGGNHSEIGGMTSPLMLEAGK